MERQTEGHKDGRTNRQTSDGRADRQSWI